ncbi:hypothetical protein WYI_22450, partial [Ochrobactrum sp. CDB2]
RAGATRSQTQFLRKALMTRVPRDRLPLSGGPCQPAPVSLPMSGCPCQENVRRMSAETNPVEEGD